MKKATAKKNAKAPKAAKAAKTTKPKKKICAQTTCRKEAVSDGYCRLHYLKNWKLIKLNNQVKAERRLNDYVDRLARKYPKDYLDRIKEGLDDEGKFKKTIEELDLDHDHENHETEREFLEKFLRNNKGE